MSRRTHIEDYEQIEQSNDLVHIVKDKRQQKRANSKKVKRRNRHYVKTMLRHLKDDLDDQ